MSAEDTIEILLRRGLNGQRPLDPREWKRVKARVAWVRKTLAAWAEAQRRMDERCRAAVGRLGEEAFNRLFEAEQAKVDAIRARIEAVIERDQWPRSLRWAPL